jgi:predicted metal-dependent phosphoesterase TrpH
VEFRDHLVGLQESRKERNRRLTKKLQELGLDVSLDEAEALGQGQTGRPHFARVLVEKGYVMDTREAFDRYLDESAPGYVERCDPSVESVLQSIREGGGLSSWAHPGRFLREAGVAVETLLGELAGKGLNAVEAYHTDHTPQEAERLRSVAQKLGLGVTGGSDFHGDTKPHVKLGSLHLPLALLDTLRSHRLRAPAEPS